MTLNTTRETLALSLQDYYDGLVRGEYLNTESFAEEIERIKNGQEVATIDYFVFFYDISHLLDPIKMISNYKGKNIVSQDKEPRPRLEELNITDDEDTMLRRLLKNAAAEVYSAIARYGTGIIGGYIYDPDVTEPIEYNDATVYNEGDLFYVDTQLYRAIADETPVGTDPEDTDYFTAVSEAYNTYNKVVYTIAYNSNMDSNMITVLDQNLEDCIVKHVIYNWYRVIQEPPMILIAQDEYNEALSKVRTSIWYRKTLVRRRTELI